MTPTRVDAIIFDMDGLLVDSEPLWRIAEIEMLSAVGAPITEEDAIQTTGLRTDEVVELWYARYPWPDPPRKEIEARIITRLIALVRERGELMPGVVETLQAVWQTAPGRLHRGGTTPGRRTMALPGLRGFTERGDRGQVGPYALYRGA